MSQQAPAPVDGTAAGQDPGPRALPLEELSREARAVFEARRYEGRPRLGELLALLRELQGADLHFEQRSSGGLWMAVAGFLGLWLGIFGTVVSLITGLIFLVLLTLPLGLVSACLLGYAVWRMVTASSQDVPDGFHRCLLPVLEALRGDVPAGARVRARIDLRGPVDEKVVKRPDSGWRGGSGFMAVGEERTWYLDPWAEVDLRLADGCRLELELFDEDLKRKVSAYTTRRKYKTKTKWLKVAHARITLTPPESAFSWNDPGAGLPEPGQGQKTSVKARTRGGDPAFRLETRTKHKGGGSSPPDEGVPPEQILGLLMRLYAALDPRRR